MPHEKTPFPATAMPDRDWWQALWPDPGAVLKKLGFRRGMVAIDLCCGNGRFTLPMSVLLDGRVYALDLDPQMLRAARGAMEDAGAPDCTWIEGDARDMVRLVAEQVDAVLIANTFHGVPEQGELVKSAGDVLKPGGHFIVVNWHDLARAQTTVLGQARGPGDEWRMRPERVREIVEPTGLVFSQTVELPPYHYGIMFQKP